jgi:hypothetical protein
MLSMAAPAVATELKVTASEARPVTVKTVPYRIRHHAWLRHHGWRGTRIAASPRYVGPDRRVSPIPNNLGCSGAWCGRQYVLMVGIGF